jgi:NADH-quinone oxidoreductase subunit N
MLIVLAALSMIVGNVVAIAQSNIKRMLAYSTISHVGFILLGVLAGTAAGYRAAMFYTLTYVIMTTASFGIVLWLSRQGFEADALDDYKGLNRRNPWFAFVMLLVMFGLAGVPPTVGFWAKLQVIAAIVNVDLTWLAALAVVMSVVGAYYYLRIVKLMYFDEPTESGPVESKIAVRLMLSVNGLAILVLGLYPGVLLRLCEHVLP